MADDGMAATHTYGTGIRVEEQVLIWMVQIHWMKLYATEQGKSLSSSLASRLSDAEAAVEALGRGDVRAEAGQIDRQTVVKAAVTHVLAVHSELSELVRPATPDSIRWCGAPAGEAYGRERRRFIAINIVIGLGSLVSALLLLPVAAAGVGEGAKGGSWSFAAGLQLASCGALGAGFYNLYWMHQHLVQRTFDRVHRNSYLARYAMGTVSGFLAALMVGQWMGESVGSGPKVSTAMAATIGGFAAEAVHDILIRLTDVLRTVVCGRADGVAASERESISAEAKVRDARRRGELAREVTEAIGKARAANAPEEVIKVLQEQLTSLLGNTSV